MTKCGIYKITSPTGRIYIGQSINIRNRWLQYKYFYENLYNESLIYHSIKKYGYENHVFEILEEISSDALNEREIYWIEFYKSSCKKYPKNRGLNIHEGGNTPPKRAFGYKLSPEAKKIISDKAKERHKKGKYKKKKVICQYSLGGDFICEWENIEEILKENPLLNKNTLYSSCCKRSKSYAGFIWRYKGDDVGELKSKIVSKKKYKHRKKSSNKRILLTKEELGQIRKNVVKKPVSAETKERMSKSFYKTRNREEWLKFLSEKFKGRKAPWREKKQTPEEVEKRMSKIRKPIIQFDLQENFIQEWASAKEAEAIGHYSSDLVSLCCRGLRKMYKNYIWKYKKDYELEISK